MQVETRGGETQVKRIRRGSERTETELTGWGENRNRRQVRPIRVRQTTTKGKR